MFSVLIVHKKCVVVNQRIESIIWKFCNKWSQCYASMIASYKEMSLTFSVRLKITYNSSESNDRCVLFWLVSTILELTRCVWNWSWGQKHTEGGAPPLEASHKIFETLTHYIKSKMSTDSRQQLDIYFDVVVVNPT